jgi:hypothetical protein
MRPSYKLISLSLFLTTAGTVGGWALTSRLGGDQAASSFLVLGAGIVAGLFMIQSLLYFINTKRLLHQVLFGAAFCLSLTWFMLCLFLPLFWVPAIGWATKLLIGGCASLFWVAGASQAFSQFNRKWEAAGATSLARYSDPATGAVEWEKVVESMKLSAPLYIPGIPQRSMQLVSVMLILLMLLGMNLRKAFPVFSAFAWGLPLSLILTIFVQMAGFAFAQALKIRQIEQQTGKNIWSGSEN